MAQTGYTPILIYSSSTGGNLPVAGSLTNSTLGSELAINITDGKLFYKDNANAIQVFFRDGTKTQRIAIEFSVGDPRRRSEGVPLLEKKFRGNLARRYAKKKFDAVYALMTDQKKLEATPVNAFMDLLAG